MALMAKQTTPLVLTVKRAEAEMVVPAEPTPREEKSLSDIDDQEGLRFQMPAIMFYRADPKMAGMDPVKVVKEALAKALIFFYPFAGRLKEGPNRNLIVECHGQGVPFFAAEADARIEDFGDEIHPPFPMDKLLCGIPGSHGMIGTPLLIIQVTRLKCGGFIVAHRTSHAITDGSGVMMLMNAIGEMARGFSSPSIPPVWDRGFSSPSIPPVWDRVLLTARDPPQVSFPHHEYDQFDQHHLNHDHLVSNSFLFGVTELAALRSHVPPHIKQYSTFDILSASLWRCRTIALGLHPDEEVRLSFAVNARAKYNPPLPNGYYGNACAFPTVRAKVSEICNNPISFILELIRKTKSEITNEYMRSTADLMVTRDRPHFSIHNTYLVSDLRHLGFACVDFGWGKPIFGGPTNNGSIPDATFFIAFKNKKGEDVAMTPISLPHTAMEIFIKEMQSMLKVHH